MARKIILDAYEQEIEDNIEKAETIPNLEEEMAMIKKAADEYIKRKDPVKLHISEADLAAMRIKAYRLGIPYHNYIAMLIHKEAGRSF